MPGRAGGNLPQNVVMPPKEFGAFKHIGHAQPRRIEGQHLTSLPVRHLAAFGQDPSAVADEIAQGIRAKLAARLAQRTRPRCPAPVAAQPMIEGGIKA